MPLFPRTVSSCCMVALFDCWLQTHSTCSIYHYRILTSCLLRFRLQTSTKKCSFLIKHNQNNYASPTSGEAYRDRRLTTNFELWVEIFCVSTCFHVRIPKPCLSVCPSVCPHPEKRNPISFVNISPTLVIDTSMERSSRVLQHGNPKIRIFFQKSSKFEIWLLMKSWNHLSFVYSHSISVLQ